MVWNAIDIARLMREARFGVDVPLNREIAVAVCRAESHFDDQAKFINTDGSIDRGLMQINSKWQPQITDECAFDPVCNIKAAFDIFQANGRTFNPWSSYKNGAYVEHLPMAKVAVEAERRLRALNNIILGLNDKIAVLTEERDKAQYDLVHAQDQYAAAKTLFNQWLAEVPQVFS